MTNTKTPTARELVAARKAVGTTGAGTRKPSGPSRSPRTRTTAPGISTRWRRPALPGV